MTTFLLSLRLLIISFALRYSYGTRFTKVLLHDAASAKGAVCLDGSPSGYFIHNGTITPNKWIIHLMGGAWCYDEDECVLRTETIYGSSENWPDVHFFTGLFSDDCTDNPYFCGWSMVFVGYCDGASFAGNVDDPVDWNGTTLYFRGFRILDAVIDEILALGGDDIEDVIFTGCSAGGLATYLHADYFRSRISSDIPVHTIVDGGYFIDAPNVNGEMHIRSLYQYIFEMQNCTGGVNQDCIAANPGEEWKCFMAQYTYPHIQTPIFLLNDRYDWWQLDNILQLQCRPPEDCTEEQMMHFENFGEQFLEAAMPAIQSQTNGVFIDSCVTHCQTLFTAEWTQIMVGEQNMRDTFYYWLTNNTNYSSKKLDCDYPCNPTCTIFTVSNSGAGSNLRLIRQINIGLAEFYCVTNSILGIIGFWLLIIFC